MLRFFTGILTLCTASAAMATECVFVAECFETDACAETTFSASIIEGPSGPDHVQFVTEAETLDAVWAGGKSLGHLIATSESAAHFLSFSKNGDVRYTTHLQGPLAITYHGTCEVTN
jgi:hypothetical protein